MTDAHAQTHAESDLRIEKCVYGGNGLARSALGQVVFVPFVLPGEVVVQRTAAKGVATEVLEASPDRVQPRCVHFGTCGGCQYQMADYPAQLRIKTSILLETLQRAAIAELPEIAVEASPEAYGYRNRIRLRVYEENGSLRLGYSVRGSNEFLEIRMCPIAAPVLWSTAEALQSLAATSREAAAWLRAAAEVEITCNEGGTQVQVHLLCSGAVPQARGGLELLREQLNRHQQPVVSLGASKFHNASGRVTAELASAGAEGLAYRVGEDVFWLKRGSFFQINRFLLPAMVRVVCGMRSGRLAWDLFAGAGLFSRALARGFDQVTAVEASPLALGELQRGLRPKRDQVVQETTLAFLRKAVLQRDRPDLVVLDPPRAGAGEEACSLLVRLQPATLVYVSCDPTTLARDLAVLGAGGYRITAAHLFDLFPQTYHLETVMVLERPM